MQHLKYFYLSYAHAIERDAVKDCLENEDRMTGNTQEQESLPLITLLSPICQAFLLVEQFIYLPSINYQSP